MDYTCYILFSKSLNRFYVGYTSDIEERLRLHNTGYFGGKSYTSLSNDWELFLSIPCSSIEQAIYLETRIKKMKSRVYIQNLKKYPELKERLLKDFNKLLKDFNN